LDSGLAQWVGRHETNAFHAWPPAQFDLTALTMVALYFHSDVQLARAHVRSAQAAEVTAGARPNPTLSVLPTGVASSFPDEPPFMMAVSLDVPIETAGKRSHRLAQARQATRAARLALAEAAWAVRARLRAALVEYFDAQKQSELFQEDARLAEKSSALLAQRLAAGDISRFDLTIAQSETLNAQIALGAAQTRVAAARSALAAALGLTSPALDQIQIAWPEFEQPPANFPLAPLQDAGLEHRLDVQRALAEYAGLEAALQLAIAGQYPDIHLDPGYEFDQGEHKFSLGPSITLPLFDHNQGPIAEATAKRDEAAAAFLALQGDAINQMEMAEVTYRAAVAEWQTADRIAAALRQHTEKSTERSVELGETDRGALLQVRLQVSAAQRARLAAIRKVQDALGALENAVQHPLSEEADWQSLSQLVAQNPSPRP
jgi:outer membrane protein TolC